MRRSNPIISRLNLLCNQQVVFRLQQISTAVNRKFEVVTVGNRILRTSFYTVATKDAAAVIDVVHLGITFIYTDSFLFRSRIISSNYVNTVRRTSSGAAIAR